MQRRSFQLPSTGKSKRITFYRTVGDKVKDPALKKLFSELAGEEKQHREFLQGMLTKDVTKMSL